MFLWTFFPESFVSSQEWTLSRNVSDIRLGIVGSLTSGKSALVHRYLTGTFVQDESPGTFLKKSDLIVVKVTISIIFQRVAASKRKS